MMWNVGIGDKLAYICFFDSNEIQVAAEKKKMETFSSLREKLKNISIFFYWSEIMWITNCKSQIHIHYISVEQKHMPGDLCQRSNSSRWTE